MLDFLFTSTGLSESMCHPICPQFDTTEVVFLRGLAPGTLELAELEYPDVPLVE